MSMLAGMLPLTSPWLELETETKDWIDRNILTDDRNVVLFGGPTVGKTSLLFQAAVTYAVEDQMVMFITLQPLAKIPLTVHGLFTPSATVLQSVKFVYYSTIKELCEFCASVHTKLYYPDIIILDDIDYFLSQLQSEGMDHGMAKICALMIDASTFIAKHSESGKCKVLISSSDQTKSLPAICEQFNFSVGSIHELVPNPSKQYDLIIKTRDCCELISNYTIQDTGIRLNHVKLHFPT